MYADSCFTSTTLKPKISRLCGSILKQIYVHIMYFEERIFRKITIIQISEIKKVKNKGISVP